MNSELFTKLDTKKLSLFIAVLCFGSIGAALISQHVFDMQPCAWCVLQRLIFILIGTMSLIFYFISGKKALGIAIWEMISLFSILGLTAAIYQLIVASKSFDCNISLAEKIVSTTKLNELIPEVFGIFSLCGDANPLVFGIPYIYYSLGLFTLIGIVAQVGVLKAIKNN